MPECIEERKLRSDLRPRRRIGHDLRRSAQADVAVAALLFDREEQLDAVVPPHLLRLAI